jgi:hypothetical protein
LSSWPVSSFFAHVQTVFDFFLCGRSRVSSSRAEAINRVLEYSTFQLKLGEDDVVCIFLKEDEHFRAILDKLENRSLDVPAFVEVKPSSTEGLGVFATKDCSPGDLILSERPLVGAISLVTVVT